MSAEGRRLETHVPRVGQRDAIPPAVGIHVGLAILCASAIYTRWQLAFINQAQWAVMVAVAVALLWVCMCRRPQVVTDTWARLCLALAGLWVLRLAYDPQLSAIPRLGEDLPETFRATYPGIGLVGVVIALLSWLIYRSVGGELDLGPAPFRLPALVATGAVMGMALVALALLRPAHGLPASETLRPMLAALQGGGLVIMLLGIGGGPGVGRLPHLYLALTLIAACVRNLAFGSE